MHKSNDECRILARGEREILYTPWLHHEMSLKYIASFPLTMQQRLNGHNYGPFTQAFLFNHCAATQATTVAGKLSFGEI